MGRLIEADLARALHDFLSGFGIRDQPLGRSVLRFRGGLNQRPSGSRPLSRRGAAGHAALDKTGTRASQNRGFRLPAPPASLDQACPDPEPPGLRRFFSTAPKDRTAKGPNASDKPKRKPSWQSPQLLPAKPHAPPHALCNFAKAPLSKWSA
nr:hypothetical protein [Agrobacterium tumefaciens]